MPGNLTVCADLSVPYQLVEAFRATGAPVRDSRKDGVTERSTEYVYAWVRQWRGVLLSLDRRYWNDDRHPLTTSPGILLLDFPPERFDLGQQAFESAYGMFEKAYDEHDWRGTKVLASAG
ncbi:MAG: hypothetical protein HY261_05740 [Chloroflexi bacterium]|nr:hypothetical protein [Chloroflexota bacterium]